MGFPNTPSNGQTAVVNGITYTYDSARTAWIRSSTTTYNLYTASNIAPSVPKLGDQWYYIATDILYEYVSDGTSSYWVDVDSLGQVGNITTIADATLQGNVVVGVDSRYSIGASNGYIKNVYANTIVANTITTGNGNVILTGNIIPSSNITYNLGTTTNRFKDLFLSGTTIDLGGATIKTDATSGAIALIPQPTVSNPNPTGIVVSPAGTVSAVSTTGGTLATNAISNASNTAVTNNTTTFANITSNGNVITSNVYADRFFYSNGTAFSSSNYGNTQVSAYLTGGNTVVGTSYWTIPVGDTAARPASAPYGATRFNSQTGWLEVYANGAWGNAGVNLGLGASAASAAASAIAIKNATGTTTDGFYWINLPTVGATRVYCDMNTNGGGWMLAAKIYNNSSQFNGYNSADWTSTTIFNETQEPTYGGHIKTNAFVYYAQTAVRLCFNNVSNNLYETGWSSFGSLQSIFNSGTNRASQNSRATWIAWLNAGGINYTFGSQPNCNAAGANQSYSYSARLGISMNNEGDCTSNDSFLGFGVTGGSPGSYGAGASDWNSGSYLNSGYQIGYIWVK